MDDRSLFKSRGLLDQHQAFQYHKTNTAVQTISACVFSEIIQVTLGPYFEWNHNIADDD